MARQGIDTAAPCSRCGAQATYMRQADRLRLQCAYCGYGAECKRPAYAERNDATRREFDLRATRNALEGQLTHIPRWQQRAGAVQGAIPMGPGYTIQAQIDKIDALLSQLPVEAAGPWSDEHGMPDPDARRRDAHPSLGRRMTLQLRALLVPQAHS